MRLLMRPDRQDQGQRLPATRAALGLSSDGTKQQAARVEAVVRALAEERLIVPVTVEASPEDPEHKPLAPGSSPLKMVDSPYGPSVVAFTSVDDLKKWDPNGRPMTMKSYRVAVGAAAGHGSGTITLNPSSEGAMLIPRAAVLALAAGDSWLPAWKDEELKAELKAAVQQACGGIVDISLRPEVAFGAESWDGIVAVDVLIDMDKSLRDAGNDESRARANLGAALEAISQNPRLTEAAQRVELVPRPVVSL